MPETFHRRGHHVQKAHGRRATLASDGSHLSGAMIALMPTAEDAKRLALKGGEKPEDLHVTLFYLGAGDDFEEPTRTMIIEHVREVLTWASPGEPLQANVFGVAHWNGNGEEPSWVWSVGDGRPPEGEPPGPGLRDMQLIALEALAMSELHDLPEQHSPWVPHICAAYTDDLTLVRELEKRLGPVTFDRIRITFGPEATDIPLAGGALTASGLRRDPFDHEQFTDFAEHNRQWEGAVASATSRMISVYSAWRVWISEQIKAGADTPEEWASLSLGSDQGVDQAAGILHEAMTSLAQRAGDALAREAERQGVEIPDWSLPDDTVTAAVGGHRLLRSVAGMTADLLATSVVQTAKRIVTGFFALDALPERIATEVDRALQEAQDGLLQAPVGQAMATAQTAGRQAVLMAAPPAVYHASEMLDKNTCAPCRAVDGEQFGDLERAIKAYPVMGYKDCVGARYGHSCRGMIVADWRPAEDSITSAGGAVPFHGNLGDPGYQKLHPGGKGKRQENGVWLGSDRYSEEEQVNAFVHYSGGGYADMNRYLRSGEHSGSDEDIERTTHALNDLIRIQEPSETGALLYRGIHSLPQKLKDGDEFHDKGFVSTSTDQSIARSGFSGPGGVVFEVKVPAGTKMLDGMKMGGYEEDSEMILPPGTRFRVRYPIVDAKKAKSLGVPQVWSLEVIKDD